MSELENRIEEAINAALGKTVEMPDLSFEAIGDTIRVEMDPGGRLLRIGYIAFDPWPPQDFWGENGEKGSFRRHRVVSTRERYLRRLEQEQGYGFDVEASLEGYRARPLGRARLAAGIYALPEAIAAEVRSGSRSVPSAMAEADAILMDYFAWSKGEACGIVVDRFQVRQDGLSAFEHDALWCVASETRAGQMLLSMDHLDFEVPETSFKP